MIIKTEEEIEKIRKSSLLVSQVHALLASVLKDGVTGLYLDKLAEEFIRDNNAVPSFKGYGGFPATLCISPNYTVVHGIPNNKPFTDKDIISIDCGAYLDGFHGDSAYTFAFQNVSLDIQKLLKVTKESLNIAIKTAKAGIKTGDIGFAVQKYCESHGYSVVRELVGHGVGRNLHESPDVPNFGKPGKGTMLKKNAVIAIEPMINLGKKEVIMEDDKWTINTKDKKMSAHFEHTVRIGLDSAEELSNHKLIEIELEKNKELLNI